MTIRGAVLLVLILTVATALAPLASAHGDPGPQLMPLHPDVLARIRAEGYDSATLVSLERLADLKEKSGIDQPELISAPVIGDRPAIVLLADFSDWTHDPVSAPSMYDDMLFSSSGYPDPGSMREYFLEVSHHLFDIEPSYVDTAWRQVPHAHNYYADADGIPDTDDDYGLGIGNYPNNAQGLVVDAVLAADPFVDFASFAIGGEVHGLFVVHTGPGAEIDLSHRDWIWSHKWSLGSHAVLADWVWVDTYSMEPEYVYSPGDSTIGVFCHEFGHVLGLPDLYDTDYSSEGLGDWSLMAGGSWNSGGRFPAYPDAWCRSQLGWVVPQVPDVTYAFMNDVYVNCAEQNDDVYRLWTRDETGTEYFLLEHRRRFPGDFDASLPGEGLLLYHVDETASQKNDLHPKVMLEQADGTWDLQRGVNRGDAGDPFPGDTDNRVVNLNTTPSTLSYAGADSQVALCDISNPGNTMYVDTTTRTWLEDDDPEVRYIQPAQWLDYFGAPCTEGHLRYHDGYPSGHYAEVTFVGTGVKWRVARGPMMGTCDVYLDGSMIYGLDLYRPQTQFVTLPKTGLSRGWHTLRVYTTYDKNPDSTGYYVTVDAFEVVP